jgi:carbamoyltransferase
MRMYLGLNSYSHDSGACLVDEKGRILAAVEEERFTENKHNSVFPERSIRFCLAEAGVSTKDLKGIAVGWDAHDILFKRILTEYLFEHHPPARVLTKSIRKLWRLWSISELFEERVGKLGPGVQIKRVKHHQAHAASAFYASGFDEAAFLTIDARGEYDTSLWGEVNYPDGIRPRGALHHPNSLGCVWAAVSDYCGFRPGWHKAGTTMALAALGRANFMTEFKKIIRCDFHKESDWLCTDKAFFDICDCHGAVTKRFEELIGTPKAQDGEYTQAHCDVAATLQRYTEEIILGKLNDVSTRTGKNKLVMAGGVCLNAIANGLILERTPFKELFIQPAAHDAGVAIGAAYCMLLEHHPWVRPPRLSNMYLGPMYSAEEIEIELSRHRDALLVSREKEILSKTAQLLRDGNIVMWFQGRSEFGPRALGSRSIIAPATDASIVGRLNKIKNREPFRPFAISILEESARDWLSRGGESPYMLLVDRLRQACISKVPAAQHVDGSVRVQTVNGAANGIYYSLLKAYADLTGIPLFLNTSFNIKGLPIVNDPAQAIRAFLHSEDVHYLAIGSFLVTKVKRGSER